MNCDRANARFCALCNVALRGWDIGTAKVEKGAQPHEVKALAAAERAFVVMGDDQSRVPISFRCVTAEGFGGKGVVTWDSTNVALHHDPNNHEPMASDGVDNVYAAEDILAGVTVYAEAVTVVTTTFKLELQDPPPTVTKTATVKVDVVAASLEVTPGGTAVAMRPRAPDRARRRGLRPERGQDAPARQDRRQAGKGLCLSTSRVVDGAPQPLGKQIVVQAIDAPATFWDAVHPRNKAWRISQVWQKTSFRAYLCVWAFDHPARGAGTQLYGILLEQPWLVEGKYFVDASGQKGLPPKVLTVTLQTAVDHVPTVSAATVDLETSPPTGLALGVPRSFTRRRPRLEDQARRSLEALSGRAGKRRSGLVDARPWAISFSPPTIGFLRLRAGS
ncbi:MAG TPA: hypothetical protein VHS09_11590, partial [Polyangiaceae bacterium]|nr:hypothetical protein [Polyangiaceae bacterium]